MNSASPLQASNGDAPDQELHQEEAPPRKRIRVAAVFADFAVIDELRYAIFISSLPNNKRQEEQEFYSSSFASLAPNLSSRLFVAGLPYKFETSLETLSDTPLYIITSEYEEIEVLEANDGSLEHPLIRGSFNGGEGKFIKFKLTETMLAGGDTVVQFYRDQVSTLHNFRPHGDFLIKTRAGIDRNGKHFVCVASLDSTIHLGDISMVPIRDTPPVNFVSDLCVKLKVQILFGGDDYGGALPCPVISNAEILSAGGASHIGDADSFYKFVCDILQKKYK